MNQPTSKEKVTTPLSSPHGEVVYEMIGRPVEHGGTQQHSLAHIVLPPGKASLLHYHQVCEETYYILRGQGRMRLDEQTFDLHPGEAVVVLPGQRHQIFNHQTEDLEFLAICAPAWYPEDSFYL
ncbi:MAG: cupin domain-containing protein [Anaerolineales bacterium]|nr:cupin domain-containing protein [Anaerolineales bacterium]